MNETFEPQDVADNKVMGVLAYIGILFLIPLLAAPKSKFARFHTNQGLVLFIFEAAFNVVAGVLKNTIFSFFPLSLIGYSLNLVSLVFLVFAILGIINAANGEGKPLPIIGSIQLIK